MTKSKMKGNPKIDEALLELAQDFPGTLLSNDTADKITMRILGDKAPAKSAPLEPEDIRALRDEAHMSQAVFAAILNLTTGYLSKLERGATKPIGPDARHAKCHSPKGYRRCALRPRGALIGSHAKQQKRAFYCRASSSTSCSVSGLFG